MSNYATTIKRHDLGDGSLFFAGMLPADFRLGSAPRQPPLDQDHGQACPDAALAAGVRRGLCSVNNALPLPRLLRPVLEWAQQEIDCRLNGLLLNWYEGPNDYIGPHRDSTRNLAVGAPIVTVSFGEQRMFRLTKGAGTAKTTHDYPAANGTVFILPFETNRAWKHSVPKSTRYLGRRISVTVRAFTAGVLAPVHYWV